MIEELAQFGLDELVLIGRDLTPEPKHPIPEMRVDACEGFRVWRPGRFVFVRLVRKDQVDLRRAGDDQHPAVLIAEPVPLLRDRIEAR